MKYDEPLSNFAFKINLSRYITEVVETPPPPVAATPRMSQPPPPLIGGKGAGDGGSGGGGGGGGGGGDSGSPAVFSLDAFLATGAGKDKGDSAGGAGAGDTPNTRTPGSAARGVHTLDASKDPEVTEASQDAAGGAMAYPDGLVTLVATYTSRMSQTVRTWSAGPSTRPVLTST